ncbi:hypothetical protein [Phenylobacterium aquaticum]|uniref:hypothetical protein n=1 Tax=Phenylobacterium aquaticum TaxID=1763816 RepID=UPI0026EEE47A|nr:hypothetical protein [Phenylobacterium aquaticum]
MTLAASLPQAGSGLGRAILIATLLAGTLDITDAVVTSLLTGRGPVRMLQTIASAILGKPALEGGLGTAALGLAIHFAIMAVMVTVFVLAAERLEPLRRQPILWGGLYGLALYGVMTWVVVPLRWPAAFGRLDALQTANQLFAHSLLVGVPIALVTAALLKTTPR